MLDRPLALESSSSGARATVHQVGLDRSFSTRASSRDKEERWPRLFIALGRDGECWLFFSGPLRRPLSKSIDGRLGPELPRGAALLPVSSVPISNPAFPLVLFFFFSLFAPGVEGGVVGACLSAAECRRNPIVPNPPRAFTTGLEWTCVCTYVCMDLCVCRAPEVEPKSCPGADRRTAGWMGDAPIRIGTPENAKPKDRLLRQIQS